MKIFTETNQQNLQTAVQEYNSILEERNSLQVIRMKELMKITGDSRSGAYLKLSDGLLPPQIPLGDRSIGFLKHEVLEVLKARILGKSNNEIKLLVKSLIKQRQLLA